MAMGDIRKYKSKKQLDYLQKDIAHDDASVHYLLRKSSDLTKERIKENMQAVWCDPHCLTGKKLDGHHVLDDDFYALSEGFTVDEEKLVDNAGQPNRTKGIGFSLSAPKGMSVAFAVGDDEMKIAILKIQQEAALAATKYVCDELLLTSSGSGRDNEVSGKGMAAIFTHLTARMEDGLIAPDIHTHVDIMGFMKRETDGKLMAANDEKLNYFRSVAENFYHMQCNSGLRKIGLETKPEIGKTAFSIPVMDKFQPVLDTLSARERKISQNMQAMGFSSDRKTWGRSDNIAAYTERHYKVEKTRAELDETWEQAIEKVGFSREEIFKNLQDEMQNNLSTPKEKFTWDDQRINRLRYEIAEQFHENYSTFHEGQLLGKVAFHMQGRADSVDEILAVFSKVKEGLVSRDWRNQAGIKLFASQKQINMEREIVELARKATPEFILEKGRVEEAIERYQKQHFVLTGPQADAIRSLTYGHGAARRCGVSEGSAGSGKTATSVVLKKIYQKHGMVVHGIALGWAQARTLGKDMGIDHAKATEAFLKGVESKKIILDSRSVVIVDECGLLSGRDAHRLLKLADAAGAKIVMQGDSRQLNSIGTSCMTTIINQVSATRIGVNADEIIRQRVPYMKQAGLDIATGNAPAAVKAYRDDGRFTISRDKDTSIKTLVSNVRDYIKADPTKSFVVIANRNSDVRLLNAEIREVKRDLGLITGDDFTLLCGDGEGKNSYEAAFAIGESIQFRLNQTDLSVQIYNRNTGRITSIDNDGKSPPTFHVLLEDGRKTSFSPRPGDPLFNPKTGILAVEPAHCQTIFTSQGGSFEKTFGLDAGDLNMRTAHVTATRHRQDFQCYVDRSSTRDNTSKPHKILTMKDMTDEFVLDHVGKRWSRIDTKPNTYDLTHSPEQQAKALELLLAENNLMVDRAQHNFEQQALISLIEKQAQSAPQQHLTLSTEKDYSYEQLRTARTVALSQPDYQHVAGEPASLRDVNRLHDVPSIKLVRDGAEQQQVRTEMLLQNLAPDDLRRQDSARESLRRSGNGDHDVESQGQETVIYQPGPKNPELAMLLDTAPVIITSSEERAQKIAAQELDANRASSVVVCFDANDPALEHPVARDALQSGSREVYFAGDVDESTREAVMRVAHIREAEKAENNYRDLARGRQLVAEQ